MTSPFSPLVTDEMLETLRGFAYQGLQTEVHILRREIVADGPYGDGGEEWVEESTTFGWIHQMNNPFIQAQAGVASVTGVFRLELPIGTDIAIADMVGVEGATYTVENTNTEDTLKVFLEAYIRRVE